MVKNIKKISVVSLLLLFVHVHCVEAQERVPSVSAIKGSFSSYKGEKVELLMRLQSVDYERNIISFYDNQNINLYFDISYYEEIPWLKEALHNTGRGLLYRVSCRLHSMDGDGVISAKLLNFKPYRLEQLP